MTMILIQANITGYPKDKPCTLFSSYDTDTRILVPSVLTDYKPRRDGCMVIANDKSSDRDKTFGGDDEIGDAIRAFYDLKNGVSSDGKSPRLAFSDKAMRADPSAVIETDGMTEGGQRYRMETFGNSHVAVLATCLYAMKADAINSASGQLNELTNMIKFMSGGIVTL